MMALVFYSEQDGITTAGMLVLIAFLAGLLFVWGDFGARY